jgi:lysophospholipase L1-like esterase
LLFAPPLFLAGAAPAPFELKDGDRVVLLGSTLVEREQRYGWWEYALTTRFPGKKVAFRNLGWSGDTVFGESHAGYAYTRTGSADVARGLEHLKEHALSLKPTVLIVGYGTNESFAGEKGLPKFVAGLNALLDALAPTRARVVLLSPLRQGMMPEPLPDPSANNKNLRLYADAIHQVAKKRKCLFVDLYSLLGDVGKVKPSVTDNGIHLTAVGYRWSAPRLLEGLGLAAPGSEVNLDSGSRRAVRGGAKVRIHVGDHRLPVGPRRLVVKGLPEGRHELLCDGKAIAAADAAEWARGVTLGRGPEFDQAEKLRKLIVAKNELYFHRWRPQNETYLFGFRKYEQGKNGPEVAKFEPLVEAKDKAIVKLSVPTPHEYALTRAAK